MIRVVIFDMDGLLIDSEPLWHRARSDLFQANGLQWTDEDHDHTMGVSTVGWVTYMASRLGQSMSAEQVLDNVLSRMEKYYREQVPLMSEANEVVSMLAGKYTLGLASGSPLRLIRTVLETAGWAKHFTQVLSSDDVRLGKPAPDIYLEIMRRLQVTPSETAIFEDSGNGILAGVAAGGKVIAVPNPRFNPRADILEQANIAIESLGDFRPELLQGL